MKAGLVTLARIIGRRFGVNVVVDPRVGTAATDGKTIWIPPVDLSAREDVEMLEGLIDHEAMHCRLTSFDVTGSNDLESSFWNIFEDIWGELDFAAIYPGTRRTIKRAAEIMASRGVIGGKLSEGAHPAELAGQTLVNGLRSRVLGQDALEDAFLHNQALFRKAVGEQLADKVWDVSQKVRDIHCTADALALAREVIALIKDEQKQQQEQQQKQQQAGGDGQGDSQSESGESKSDGSGKPGNNDEEGQGSEGKQAQGEGESQSQGDADADSGRGQGDQADNGASGGCEGESGKQQQGQPSASDGNRSSGSNAGQDGSQPGGNSAGASNTGVDPETLAKTLAAIQEILNAHKEDFGKIDLAEIMEEAMPLSKSIDFSTPAVEKPRSVQGWDATIGTMVRTLRNTLSARLAHLFDTQEETKTWLDKSGRRLDAGKLAAVQTGERHVFRKLEYGDEVSVEVSLVIDCSSSMNHALSATASRLEAAQSVALALGDVLEQHEIPFSVTLFARSVCAYKVADQNWKAARRNVVGLRESGSTNTAAAVVEASKDILFSDRERRLMLVVTDGVPNHVEFAVSESAEIQKTGVEVRYIMIGDDHAALSRALRNAGISFSVANSPDVLAKAVFEAVEPRLALRNAA